MKKFIVLSALATSFSLQALELDLSCAIRTNAGKGQMIATTSPFKLTSEDKKSESTSSKLIDHMLNFDDSNSILVSLNRSSGICSKESCDELVGKIYTLSLVRFENTAGKASQLKEDYNEKVRGQTSATVKYTVMDSGEVTASYYNNGKFKEDSAILPKEIKINYSVTRGLLKKRQQIEVACSLAQIN